LVPFAGLLAGLKLAGLNPAKCPVKSPKKKVLGKSPNSNFQISPSSLRQFLPSHIIIEVSYSNVIKDISIRFVPSVIANLERRAKIFGLRMLFDSAV